MAKGQIKQKQVNIDKSQFESLCAMQCTEEEICSFFNISEDTLVRWCKATYDGKNFAEVFAEKRLLGRISLRRHQMRLAETNATMLIWLGKQYLGQKDEQTIEINRNIDESLKAMDEYFGDSEANTGNNQIQTS